MNTRYVSMLAGLLMGVSPTALKCQQTDEIKAPEDQVIFSKKSLAGPRLGFTIVPGNSEIGRKMEEAGMSRVISQFGWHFEHRVSANGNGPTFVVEFVPLVGGVEYGKPITSLSLLFGIRMPSGFEFGVGPNLLIATDVNSGLIIAIGKTFDVQGVSIPINLAFGSSPVGSRLAFIVGYAI